MEAAEAVLTDVDYAKDAYDCARDADALVHRDRVGLPSAPSTCAA